MSQVIIYDHREERSTIPGLLALEGFSMEAKQLPVGDYILSERLIIERKTANDLIASIKDRRLWEQAERLKEAYPVVVLLIEGTPERFPVEGWKGALGSILTMGGISVLPTQDIDESCEWIARLAKREQKGPSGARGGKRKSKDSDKLAEGVISSLPGISTKGARALLEHFKTLNGVFNADAAALQEVPGIGKKRAEEMAKVFHHFWNTAPWDRPPEE